MGRKQSPLELAVAGGTSALSERQKSTALTEALKKLTSLEKKASNAATVAEETKGQTMATLESLLTTMELQGSAFLASGARGFLGDKMIIAGIDPRLVGLPLAVWGLYSQFEGSEAAPHLMALSNGVLASWTSEQGHALGAMLAEQRQSKQGGAASTAAKPAVQGDPQPSAFGAQVPQPNLGMYLTPEDEPAADVAGPFRPGRRPVVRRVVRRRRQGGRAIFPTTQTQEQAEV